MLQLDRDALARPTQPPDVHLGETRDADRARVELGKVRVERDAHVRLEHAREVLRGRGLALVLQRSHRCCPFARENGAEGMSDMRM